MVRKADWRKELRHLYGPSAKQVAEVEVPEMRFLMVDGEGDPNGPGFGEATAALYALSYAVKFASKKRGGLDHAVSPLEGLWWMEGQDAFDLEDEEAWSRISTDRHAWRWTLMVMQPEHVSRELLEEARADVKNKKDMPILSKVRFEPFQEGRVAQIMHRGPYAEEWPTIREVHRFIDKRGVVSGKHHEIYLNHPARTAPEKLRTIIRQPFATTG